MPRKPSARERPWWHTGEGHSLAERYPRLARFPEPLILVWLGAAERDLTRRDRGARLAGWGIVFILAGFGVVSMTLAWVRLGGVIGEWIGYLCLGLFALFFVLLLVRAPKFERALDARLDVELRTGRFVSCMACDYDHRGTRDDVCPECGESVWIADWRRKFGEG
jgi:hypothetical protein